MSALVLNAKRAICSNCGSKRRQAYRAGFCRKCHYWHREQMRLEREVQAARATPKGPLRWCAPWRRLQTVNRVLEEYAWREENLNADAVEPVAIEGLLNAVAWECRSEICFRPDWWLERLTPDARKCFFSILLEIVENVPARLPRLHTLERPRRGLFWSGWDEWYSESRRDW